MTQDAELQYTAIKNKEILFSSCLFALLLGLFCFVNSGLEKYSPSTIQLINQITAHVVSGVLNLIGIKFILSGGTISIHQGGALQIIYECTGIYVFLIFTAFVLSYPAFIHQKLLGLAVVIPILYLFNVFRIASLAIIQLHWPQYLDPVHKYLWEATFMVLVMAMTYLWLLWINGQLRSRFHRFGPIFKILATFILYSCLGYGLLMLLFRPYLLLLQGLVNAGLSLTWKYWLDYWPMRLAVENKELWLIYAAGKIQIHDIAFLAPNLIPFVSLMLVSRLRPRIKASGIAIGGAILCAYHAFTLILVIQKLAERWLYLYTFFRAYLLFLLPVILWLLFFLFFREQKKENEQGEGKGAGTSTGTGKEKENAPKKGKKNMEMGIIGALPGATLSWKVFYAILGIILPAAILLFGNKPGPGYYLGFFLWLVGLLLILPQSTFLTGRKGKKRTTALIILYTLLWQGPLTANSLLYVPEGKRALFLTSDSQPSSCAEEGVHVGFCLTKKPIFFDLQGRSITIQIMAQVKEEARPVLAADLEVVYQVSGNSDLAEIYLDFGDSMEKIDQALMERLKQQIGAELQKYLSLIVSGSMNAGRIQVLLKKAVKKSLALYKIELSSLKIIDQGHPQITLGSNETISR